MGIMEERNLHCPNTDLKYLSYTLSKYEDFRIFKGATILTAGEWADSITRTPVVYSEKELHKACRNWESNYLNLDHSIAVDDRIGYVMNPYFDKGAVKGDLYIHRKLQKGRDTIRRIDCGLVNWVSAEITTKDRVEYKENKRYAEEITFIGTAVVNYPACEKSIIK